MPLFYIDLHDGTNFVRDKKGFELPDAGAAREKLGYVLKRVSELLDTTKDGQIFLASVRDHAGTIIMRARLTLAIEELETA